jgi:hypothetical protein
MGILSFALLTCAGHDAAARNGDSDGNAIGHRTQLYAAAVFENWLSAPSPHFIWNWYLGKHN